MKKKYLFVIIPITLIIFSSIISIGYSSWIISEPISIQTSEISIEDVTFKDASYYEVTYDGEGHAPHIDLSDSIPDDVLDYEVKYYKKGENGSTSGLYNGRTDYGEYTAEYYNTTTKLVTQLSFKINKAVLNVTIPDQYCYYSLNSTPDTTKFPVVKGIKDETIEGEWILDEDTSNSETRTIYDEGGEKDKHYSLFNYKFVHNNPNYEEITNIQVKLCYYSVAYLGSGGTSYYCSLNNALDAANTGKTKDVYILPNLYENRKDGAVHPIEVYSDITLESGTTLTIPYDNEVWTPPSGDELSAIQIDTSEKNVRTYRKSFIKVLNGADITINSGAKLYIGGEYQAKGVCRNYSEVNLGANSSINVYGELYVYGYIKESVDDAKNAYQIEYTGRYDNDYDEGRKVSVYETGFIQTGFTCHDLSGGGTLLSFIENNICPINQFEFQNVQTYLEVYHGGRFNALANFYVAGQPFTTTVDVVGNDSSSAIFKLVDGYLTIQYNPADVLYGGSDKSFTSISLHGTLNQGFLKIQIQSYPISTETNYLPISYKFKIYFAAGSTYNTSYKIKLLPGSELYIEENSTVNINNSIIFYKEDSYSQVDGISYPLKPDAKFINNGTLNINSNGSVGGLIETSNQNGTALINFNNVDSSGLLSVSPDGNPSISNVTIQAEGYFFNETTAINEIRQFVAGTTLTSSINNIGCWEGESYKLNTLEIKVDKSESFKYNVLGYQVYTYSDADGNGKTELTSGVTDANFTFNIQSGQYFSISTSRIKAASFENSDLIFESGDIYQMNNDMILNILPSEGILITFDSTVTNQTGDKQNSGLGNSSITFYEGTTNSTSNRATIGEFPTEGSFIMIKGNYLSFKCSGGIGQNGTLSFDTATISPSLSGDVKTLKSNTPVKIDGETTDTYNISFEWEANFCVTSDTLITLADGTQVRIDQLTGHELLRVWNHVTGTFINVPIGYLIKHNDSETLQIVTKLSFNNDSFVKIIGDHTFYNASLNKYIILNENNAHLYVGDYFIYESNGKLEKVQLISADTYEEYTIAYSIETFGTITSFANGILSATPYLEAVLNAFDINNETFIYENMEEDIDKYGVYSYYELSDLMTYEEYQMTNAKYFKVAIEKGIITWEEFMQAIEIFRSVEGDFIN